MARLDGRPRGYQRHPAVRMWEGHESFLLRYLICAAREWRRRGHRDGALPEYVRDWLALRSCDQSPPKWWGRHDIHAVHRRELLRRLPEHYGAIWPDERAHDERRLVWPIA